MVSAKSNLVRLMAAVIGSAICALFVIEYSRYSRLRFEIEHEGGTLTEANAAMASSAQWLFILPVATAVLGVLVLRGRPAPSAIFEAIVAGSWILSLALVLLCVLSWQIQNVPVFSHMEWHY